MKTIFRICAKKLPTAKAAFTLTEGRLACTNTQSLSHLITSQRAAFTLAEVLITLAIIGIVAALTIPAVVKNYQERAWNTASTVFERKLEEALKSMNAQETLAGYTNTLDFANELSKHIKINKICKNDNLMSCFENKVYWGADRQEIDMEKIKNAKNLGQKDWGTENIGIQFANGVTALAAYNPDCSQDPYNNQYTGISCLAMLYDTDGFKNPNTQLKDLRSINVPGLNGKNCAFEIGEKCWGTPFHAPRGKGCNEEEMNSEFGLSCPKYGGEYWSEAVKMCKSQGGVLASSADVRLLEKEFYNGLLDKDKAAEYGFVPTHSCCPVFGVFIRDGLSSSGVSYPSKVFGFYSKKTGADFNGSHSKYYAVCIF